MRCFDPCLLQAIVLSDAVFLWVSFCGAFVLVPILRHLLDVEESMVVEGAAVVIQSYLSRHLSLLSDC